MSQENLNFPYLTGLGNMGSNYLFTYCPTRSEVHAFVYFLLCTQLVQISMYILWGCFFFNTQGKYQYFPQKAKYTFKTKYTFPQLSKLLQNAIAAERIFLNYFGLTNISSSEGTQTPANRLNSPQTAPRQEVTNLELKTLVPRFTLSHRGSRAPTQAPVLWRTLLTLRSCSEA